MIGTAELESRIRGLEPWFHDLDLHGVQTAPDHPLGPFLRNLWMVVQAAFPDRLDGKTVLDIGCNAGFYSFQLHERGAVVTGIDHDPHYLEQARFAAEVLEADVEFRQMDVYDVEKLGRNFDYVLFMGVFYHLRYPLLGLDRVARLPRERLIFQTMVRGSEDVVHPEADYAMDDRGMFEDPAYPAMYFVEHSYAGDPTNWWIPNESAVGALLRSAGLRIESHEAPGVYFCSRAGR